MRFAAFLFGPVSIKPLIRFRILFGLLLCFDCCLHIAKGWVDTIFIKPTFHFGYIGLEFIKPLPGNLMIYYFVVMAVVALLIAVGLFYRFSVICFTLLFTGSFLMDKTFYNNHNYLIILLCLMMCVAPANKSRSIDVRRGATTASEVCGRWVTFLFIFQAGVLYFFGAVNKLHPDWFSGRFISIAFASKANVPYVGWVYQQHWFHLFIAYAGFVFDLSIVPLLLYKRTRNAATVAYFIFHLFNSFSFHIGIFPFIAMGLLLFLNGSSLLTIQDTKINTVGRGAVFYLVLIYIFMQVVVPVRHLLYPGDVNWTQEGDRFAWRMMLKHKQGFISYKLVDANERQTVVNPRRYLSKYQYQLLVASPDMIWQYAQHLEAAAKARGWKNPKVYSKSYVTWNKRPYALLTDTMVDLSKVRYRKFEHNRWILLHKERR